MSDHIASHISTTIDRTDTATTHHSTIGHLANNIAVHPVNSTIDHIAIAAHHNYSIIIDSDHSNFIVMRRLRRG